MLMINVFQTYIYFNAYVQYLQMQILTFQPNIN